MSNRALVFCFQTDILLAETPMWPTIDCRYIWIIEKAYITIVYYDFSMGPILFSQLFDLGFWLSETDKLFKENNRSELNIENCWKIVYSCYDEFIYSIAWAVDIYGAEIVCLIQYNIGYFPLFKCALNYFLDRKKTCQNGSPVRE